MTKQNHNVLEWDDVPRVAMPVMNEVHQEELTLVNRLNSLLEQAREDGSGREAFNQMWQQWIEHTKAHFARENMMMEQYAFPAYPCHQGEHEQALQELESQYQQWQEVQDIEKLTDYVQNIWPAWYVQHISTMDVVTSALSRR